MKAFKTDDQDKPANTLFMPENWRSELCKCDDCIKIYDDNNLGFLKDPEDTVHFYESKAKAQLGGN